MHAIALLVIVAATAQAPPPDDPPPLKPGENAYAIRLTDGTEMYVRARPADYDERAGTGEFWPDEPDAEISGRVPFTFTKIWPVMADDRERNWKQGVEEWREANGYVRTTFADGATDWVREQDLEWSDRARAAALQVMQARNERESITLDGPALSPTKTQSEEAKLGFLQLWGPQLAVGVLALVLMGVVIRVFFVSEGTGWQKLE